MTTEETRRTHKKVKKSKQRGWFRVENIIGHRINRVKNKDKIELQVKWEDYGEPTWEAFCGFVKDTAPIVERYLLRKNLMKSLSFYQELKRQKLQAQLGSGIDDDKATFGDIEATPGEGTIPVMNLMDQPSSTMFDHHEEQQAISAAPSTRVESEMQIREVCCCPLSKKDKSGSIEPSQLNYCRFNKTSDLDPKSNQTVWQNIILKV